MLAYRDHGRAESGSQFKAELLRALARVDSDSSGERALEALLRAGELECALADARDPSASRVARVTDAMAAHVLAGHASDRHPRDSLRIEALSVPSRLRASVPEGYAYYALDPAAYADLVDQLGPLHSRVLVIGVRSIGTSLGAIVCEALLARGALASRISVRPEGHPWARTLRWSAQERALVERARDAEAQFIVVDEGPGLSGSTFLSVADALSELGIASSRIALFCSHAPDPARLTAEDAATRWARYRSYAARGLHSAAPQDRDLSAGAWRKRVFGADPLRWPASWIQLERIKWLSEDGRSLDKFEGLPPYCEAPSARASALEQAGYGPALQCCRRGFLRFEWIEGRAARSGDLDRSVIAELARYCAFRSRSFAVADADPAPIIRMLRANIQEAFGLDVGEQIPIAIETPIIPDARMQPHEWCFSSGGRLIKFDGHAHGDGHLLPGPTDVCWDLAGAIIEWEMDPSHRDALVAEFERAAGARVRSRLDGFLVAYAALRVAEMSLALLGAAAPEALRLSRARARYARQLERLLQTRGLLC
jgi:hypothetical protein